MNRTEVSSVEPRISTLGTPAAPWGAYGDLLTQGIGHWEDDRDQTLGVSRVGPFVPPISFPSGMGVLVTAPFRAMLEESGLGGARFLTVKKHKVVRLDWSGWDRTATMPQRLPPGGEPENYILSGRHNPDTSAELGRLFELRPTRRLRFVDCGSERKWGSEWRILRPSRSDWHGEDFFLGERGYVVYVTARCSQWIKTHATGWVKLEPAIWGT